MLEITVPAREYFNQKTGEFINFKEVKLQMEHSLISIQKWESIYHKPFLSRWDAKKRTPEENLAYIKCMTITKNVPDDVYYRLTVDNMKTIAEYIDNPMSAHKSSPVKKGSTSSASHTAEYYYAIMVLQRVPKDYAKWHFNQLVALLDVLGDLQEDPKKKKVGRNEQIQNYRDIEAHNRELLAKFKSENH